MAYINEMSQQKIQSSKLFISILIQTRLIQAIFYTGSVSYGTAKLDDDIDILIVTRAGRLYTVRFIALFLAMVLGVKRWPGQQSVHNCICMNIWLDERDLSIPKIKKSPQGLRDLAHLLPAYDPHNIGVKLQSLVEGANAYQTNYVEHFLYILQRWYMRARITNEIITPTQAWFHPRCFPLS